MNITSSRYFVHGIMVPTINMLIFNNFVIVLVTIAI